MTGGKNIMLEPKVSSRLEFLENIEQYERYTSETIRRYPEFKSFVDSELEINGPNYIVACWILGAADKMTAQALVAFNVQIMKVKRTTLIRQLTGNTCNQIFLRSLSKLWLNEMTVSLLYNLLDCCQNKRKATVLSHTCLILPTLIDALATLPSYLVHTSIVQNIASEMYFAGEVQMALSGKVINASKEYQDQISKIYRTANDTIDLEEGLFRLFKRQNISIDFPSPPIPGNRWLIPIRSHRELYEEGMEMDHCVKNYTQKVIDNESYFFKWVEKERATIQLIIDKHKCWYIEDVRGYNNEELNVEQTLVISEEVASQFENENVPYILKP